MERLYKTNNLRDYRFAFRQIFHIFAVTSFQTPCQRIVKLYTANLTDYPSILKISRDLEAQNPSTFRPMRWDSGTLSSSGTALRLRDFVELATRKVIFIL